MPDWVAVNYVSCLHQCFTHKDIPVTRTFGKRFGFPEKLKTARGGESPKSARFGSPRRTSLNIDYTFFPKITVVKTFKNRI